MAANPLGRALRNRHAGEQSLAWARPELQATGSITLTSPEFTHGQPFPERFRGTILRTDTSPALAWTAPPGGTAALVLVVQDRDVPFRHPATHGLAVIPPDAGGLPENGLAHPSPVTGVRIGKGPLGRRGWTGPRPIPSHGPHRYVFQLFALDRAPDLPEKFGLPQVLAAMPGHVLARARLDATYEIS